MSTDNLTVSNRSSNYDRDRDRGTSDIKKRLDDFPSKRSDDSYSSKRESYKSSRDDFKRDLEVPRHTSSSYGGGSNRIESNSTVGKERYSDRSASDYRGTTARSDDRDSRNTSSKPRYLDPPAETRFSDRPTIASSGAWNSGASNQTFSLNTPGIWAENKVDTNSTSWCGLDDRYGERFASNDRKPLITPQFIEPSVRTNQFIAANPAIIARGSRFANNRYDNGRF